ncbi:hypothetical protein ACTJJ0_08645 [Chitinophaga sp. 22321]|uniref:ABC-2 type transport system permease protein n=1 Tax=Chitinophaga hostae TaxID=2831022 RepID=A0ABS5ITZ3_9BACT|nr:hypothetical protein [Chitinophaga hostae]MBS0026429.1 hypothetical protein [Chitinophaga hostae]
MQANNIFNFRRMQLYLQKHFADQLRFYLMGAVATFGLVTLIGILLVLTHNHFDKISDIVPFYYVGLFAGGLLFTSRSFNELAHKEKGVDFLLLPASQFEKFLTLFLISTIGFFLFYHISFYLSVNIVEKVQIAVNGLHVQNDYKFLSDPDEKVYVYYVYFVLQAIFLFGATCFHKYSFIKTVLCVLLFLFGLFLINSVIVTLLFGWKSEIWKSSIPFVMVHKMEVSGRLVHGGGSYLIPRWLLDAYAFILRFIFAPVFWTLAYFRLKDQEI